MLPAWLRDKARFDPFMKSVKSALGPFVIDIADAVADREEATDLVVGPSHIAVRGRSVEYLSRYPYDITFRMWRTTGATTEWEKIIQRGYGDKMFYFFADESTASLSAWRVIDLHRFRSQWVSAESSIRCTDQANNDGKTGFRAVDSRSLEPGVQLGSWSLERLTQKRTTAA